MKSAGLGGGSGPKGGVSIEMAAKTQAEELCLFGENGFEDALFVLNEKTFARSIRTICRTRNKEPVLGESQKSKAGVFENAWDPKRTDQSVSIHSRGKPYWERAPQSRLFTRWLSGSNRGFPITFPARFRISSRERVRTLRASAMLFMTQRP